jgi:hypothetical protein
MTVAVGRLQITLAITTDPAPRRETSAERARTRRSVNGSLNRDRWRWESVARRATPWL